MRSPITVQTKVRAPLEKVWRCWTEPEHITKWYNASTDWHAPRATNDLRPGGMFNIRMEAKDGSAGFDFAGTYLAVTPLSSIEYVMGDGRKARTMFAEAEGAVEVTQTFDPEDQNPPEMQRGGWQAILDNFKLHVEAE